MNFPIKKIILSLDISRDMGLVECGDTFFFFFEFHHILVSYVYLKYIECVFGLESNELFPIAAIILSVFYGS